MELKDFKIGQKYRKAFGADKRAVLTCIYSSESMVELEYDNGSIWRVIFNTSDWEHVEPAWIPERGELLKACNGGMLMERIFITEIEGACRPYLCVASYSEEDFKSGKRFHHVAYRTIVQLEEPVVKLEINGKSVELSADKLKAIRDAVK